MAEQEGRSEQATGRRKEEARQKGQVAVSRDVSTAAILLGGLAFIYALIGVATTTLSDLMREWLSLAADMGARQTIGPDTFHALMMKVSLDVLGLSMPLVGGVAVIGMACYLAQTGFMWNSEGLRLDVSRISLLKGFGRLFSLRSVAELVKSILKITVITWIGVMAIRQDMTVLPSLIQYDLEGVLGVTGGLAFKLALWIGLTVAVLAGADYGYQRFEWERGLRMSKQEIKQERRESEGDPMLRSRVRSLQREMARKRMITAVPKADVVITNPTHLAVALRYDFATMGAPVVVAKGAGFLAERIKTMAAEHGVMVIENKFVARTLYKLVEVGQEVPADLYRAVAEILALVFRSKGQMTLR
ncbi:MAG: flagellar biosynthesis protein FlhB [Nitrospirae bacterium]|nr:MAG: flagellar biosynthesis protein FlhB [Nitrospirota bacterium]